MSMYMQIYMYFTWLTTASIIFIEWRVNARAISKSVHFWQPAPRWSTAPITGKSWHESMSPHTKGNGHGGGVGGLKMGRKPQNTNPKHLHGMYKLFTFHYMEYKGSHINTHVTASGCKVITAPVCCQLGYIAVNSCTAYLAALCFS